MNADSLPLITPIKIIVDHAILVSFVVTFIMCFGAFVMSGGGLSLLQSIVVSAAPALLVASAFWFYSLDFPMNEQNYECRTSGGELEYFGKRGWVCIRPKG